MSRCVVLQPVWFFRDKVNHVSISQARTASWESCDVTHVRLQAPEASCPQGRATDLSYMFCRACGMAQLPEELLFTIMGLLDVLSLCTARLVSRQFRQSASGYLKALHLDWADLAPSINFTHFAGLTRLAVSSTDVSAHFSIALIAHPRIAPFITHLDMRHLTPMEMTAAVARLPRLPKLRALRLRGGMAAMESLPLWLEELHVTSRDFWPGGASLLTRLSGLTSLHLDMLVGEASVRSLAGLPNLCSLRLLLDYCPSHSGVLTTLTSLTSLTVQLSCSMLSGNTIFSELARLTGLSHLEVIDHHRGVVMRHGDLASLASLTALTCLSLKARLAACVAGSSALTPLTRLVSVGLGRDHVILSHLPSLNVEALQSLALSHVHDDISVLRRATGLTHLSLSCSGGPEGYRDEVVRIVDSMSRLQALELDVLSVPEKVGHPGLSRIVQTLMGLTRLRYSGKVTMGRDLEACASLPGLRVLELHNCTDVTVAFLPALQALTGLTELDLKLTLICKVDLTRDVRAAFNVERLRCGWPPLRLKCQSLFGM
jgi:hypothetical protein